MNIDKCCLKPYITLIFFVAKHFIHCNGSLGYQCSDRVLFILFNPSTASGTMYVPDTNIARAKWYNLCTTKVILDNCFVGLVLLLLMYSDSTFHWHGPFPGSARRKAGIL